MPYTVIGKGLSWVGRIEELDVLTKGQLRYIAIEAGKILRRHVEQEGLVDTGLLRHKIGEARKVDDYLWVVPAFGEVGGQGKAPSGTIRDFLQWYRQEREVERAKGRVDRSAKRRQQYVTRPRTKIRQESVRSVLRGETPVSELTVKEARAAFRRYRREQFGTVGLPYASSAGALRSVVRLASGETVGRTAIRRIEAYTRKLRSIASRGQRQMSFINAFRSDRRLRRMFRDLGGPVIRKSVKRNVEEVMKEIDRLQKLLDAARSKGQIKPGKRPRRR